MLLGSLRLPTGHCLVRRADEDHEDDEALLWATDGKVEGAGRLWLQINNARPDGKGCVLLDWPEYEHPWGKAALPFAASSPEAIGTIDVAFLLSQMWELSVPDEGEYEEDDSDDKLAPIGRAWRGLAPAATSTLSQQVLESAVFSLSPARVGVVSTPLVADVPALLAWNNGVNSRPLSSDLSALLRSWQNRFGARLLVLGTETLDLLVERPPADHEHALRVAAEHYAICPDIIDQGVGSLSAHASQLVNAPLWHFWWD